MISSNAIYVYRSAKELAKAWLTAFPAKPPRELMVFLQEAFPSQEVILTEATAELVIPLDSFGGQQQRNADLVILGESGPQRLLVSIEAKADESFGDLVGAYYDAKMTTPGSNVPSRITGLVRALFASELDHEIRELRYQLIHATAATLIEAQNRHAEVAVFLVHEFISEHLESKKLESNRHDWENFVQRLGRWQAAPVDSGKMSGPLYVPGGGFVPSKIPLYIGKIKTPLG